jgi:hypothetical protein
VEKVLALDISSKTGWSVGEASAEGFKLLQYGLLTKTERPDTKYPSDYVQWAINTARPIIAKIEEIRPDVLVIEETASGSKSNYSQKILEFIHYIVAEYIVINKIKTRYFLTGEWRVIVGAKMNSSESKNNKKTKDIKKKTGLKLAKDENGKRLGKITKKHVNVRRANEIFGLSLILKNEDIADGILLGYGYYLENYKNKI